MKSILVTGGAGFIGSHTCLILLEQGFEIYILDSFENSSNKSLEHVSSLLKKNNFNYSERFHIFNGDLREKNSIKEIFKKAKANNKNIDAVIHFAGLKSVEESIFQPLKYWYVNVYGTLNLLDVMHEYGCKTIVFSSSATIYGKAENLIGENALINPINPYGTTKSVVEKFLKDIYQSSPNDWRIANLRYFNPIGAHPSGELGEDPQGKPNNIFPILTKVATGKIKELKVYGNDYPTKDGTGIRDYIHIMDLAEGHIQALRYLYSKSSDFINLNIGTGIGTSVLELIEVFQEVNNIKIPYKFDNRRKGDSAIVIADNTFTKNVLNWEPKISIEQMCKDGYNWQLKNPNGF